MAAFLDTNQRLNSFEAAALPCLDQLFRTAVRMVGNPIDAQDLIQEVYLHAWQSFHRFQPGTNCKAWLFKIMFHRLQHRRRALSRVALVSLDELLDSLRQGLPVPDKLEDKEIIAALDRLPAAFREVLLLSDLEDLAYKEIAETLDIRLGTVMSRLSRARKLLRADLAVLAAAAGIGKKNVSAAANC